MVDLVKTLSSIKILILKIIVLRIVKLNPPMFQKEYNILYCIIL